MIQVENRLGDEGEVGISQNGMAYSSFNIGA